MPIKNRLSTLIVAVAVGVLTATTVHANPVVFIHAGSGSGSIDGNVFADADFVITAVAETSNLVAVGDDVSSIEHDSALISIVRVGDFSFSVPTRTFVNRLSSSVGFSRSGSGDFDLFNGPTDPVFSTYDLLTSIGPVNGSGRLLQWDGDDIVTSGGILQMNSESDIAATFTASVVSEPSGGLLAVVCMVVALWRRP